MLAHSVFSLSSLSVPQLGRVRAAADAGGDGIVRTRAAQLLSRLPPVAESLSASNASTSTNSAAAPVSSVLGSKSSTLAPYQSLFVSDFDAIDEGFRRAP